ncbi:hypothetical protein TWF694_000154 [Orbilia ellipsospora]|uniref:Uncharacterized protein n=1 Tax=Orbilia ellipsospora TaxID=2528407 RepID=A0AAV9XMS4_9PEZI
MLSTAARRTALTTLQTTSRRMVSTAAAHHPPSSVHTKITAGIGSASKSSGPAVGFYTARLGRTLTLVLPVVAVMSWPFVTRGFAYSTGR